MKIAFLDFTPWDYAVSSPYESPLGGSQSALCYLAEELARRGHEVFLLNNTSRPGPSRGVTCLSLRGVPESLLTSLNVAVVLNNARAGCEIKDLLSSATRLVLWTQHAHDQPAMQALHETTVCRVYDSFALVSHWQRDCYLSEFPIDPAATRVLRNAVSPAFVDSFAEDESVWAPKPPAPLLAYTSTPFRGLDILLAVFPHLRKRCPTATLKIFSSMRVYHVPEDQDEASHGKLYETCRTTAGVEHVGSLPQPELARQMRSVAMLTYPNHFAETSCIAVMEAMACGCRVITSDLGALAETTAGFARLVEVGSDWSDYARRFLDTSAASIDEIRDAEPDRLNAESRRQIEYIHSHCTWPLRAAEWESWLRQPQPALR